MSDAAALRLRPATALDVPALTVFENLVFADEPHRITPRQWRELVRRAPGLTVVADSPEATRLAGVLVLGSRGRTLRILSLGVHPDFRRRGVATLLLAHAEKAARGAGLVRIRLEVRAENQGAIALYAAHGYSMSGILQSYYGLAEDGVRMELVLAETELR